MPAEIRIALMLAAAVPLAAQHPARNQDRVWIDATVLDSAGRSVPGLTAADFEIQHEGKSLPIAEVTYVRPQPPAPDSLNPNSLKMDSFNIAVVPSPLAGAHSDDQRLAVIVDDLSFSPETANRVHSALLNFVNSPEQAPRLVAILRTSAGTGTSQQFTADRAILQNAIDHVTGRATATDPNRVGGSTGSTLLLLRSVFDGLHAMSGRKTVVLLSENMQLYQSPQVPVFDLTQRANLASVVFYAVDPRGLETPSAIAAMSQIPTYAGLGAVARDTGGIFFDNTNDAATVISRVLQDQEGYYQIICPMDELGSLVKGIAITLKRADLRLRSRTVFVNADGTLFTGGMEAAPLPASPFATGAIPVHLTPLLSYSATSTIEALLHVDVRGLTFTRDSQGFHNAELELVAAGFYGNGRETRRVTQAYRIRIPDALYEASRSQGASAAIALSIDTPGLIQVEAVVRDTISGRVGSARQAFDFPDLKNGQLVLSGLFLSGGTDGKPGDPGEDAAVRVFKPGRNVNYVYSVFNARMDADKRAFLEMRIRVLREGQEILVSGPVAVPPETEPDPARRMRKASIHLLPNAKPGRYVLEVTVTDKIAGAPPRTVTQTIGFEVR